MAETPAPRRNGAEKAREAFFSWQAARFYLAAAGAVVATMIFVWQSQAAQDSERASLKEGLAVLASRQEAVADIKAELKEQRCILDSLRTSTAVMVSKIEALGGKVGDIDKKVDMLDTRINGMERGCP